MKAIFGSLLCLVLAVSQSFALKGGPPYPGGGNLKGTYAGVMQGVFDPTNPRSSNTLGLFSLSIPTSGFATGTVVIFVAGRTFTGTISGIGDPNKSKLQAVVQSTATTHIILCNAQRAPLPTDVIDRADGTVDASIIASKKAAASVTGTLLNGTGLVTATQSITNPTDCQLALVNSSALSLIVDGFKQSTS